MQTVIEVFNHWQQSGETNHQIALIVEENLDKFVGDQNYLTIISILDIRIIQLGFLQLRMPKFFHGVFSTNCSNKFIFPKAFCIKWDNIISQFYAIKFDPMS